jgi:hypothetical protein
METANETKISYCVDCGSLVHSPHRNRCFSCNLKRVRGEPLPEQASCGQCGEQRRGVLKWVVLEQERIVLCHNCHHLALKLRPRPESLAEIRLRLQRLNWNQEQRLAYLLGRAPQEPGVLDELSLELEALADSVLFGER